MVGSLRATGGVLIGWLAPSNRRRPDRPALVARARPFAATDPRPRARPAAPRSAGRHSRSLCRTTMLGCPNSCPRDHPEPGRPDARPLAPAQHGARAPRSLMPAPGASASAAASVARRHAALAAAAVALTGVLVGRSSPPAAARPTRPTSPAPRPWRRRRRQRDPRVPRGPRVLYSSSRPSRRGSNDAHRIHRRPIAAGASGAAAIASRRGSSSSRRLGALGAGEPRCPGRDRTRSRSSSC